MVDFEAKTHQKIWTCQDQGLVDRPGIWSDFQTETRVNLSHSIKQRLPEVLKNKGGPIDY